MRRQGMDRLLLSLVAEPTDQALRRAVTVHGVEAVAAACRGEQPAELPVPEAWLERAGSADMDGLLAHAAATGARWVVPGDGSWPGGVDDLGGLDDASAPWGLWVRGEGNLAGTVARSVAVVGARSATTYGAEVAAELAADLADRHWSVVSGAAFGIDASAHRGALVAAGRTVAVMACGVDVAYPRAHAALLDRIAAEGLLVSEYPPGCLPQPHRFLARNRLIAALSGGTVVVEAARRSGALNTLHWADRLGRVTMGVPGPVLSMQSAGVHRALRDGEALLVANVDDIEEEMRSVGWPGAEPVALVDDSAEQLCRLLEASLPQSVLTLAASVDRPVAAVRADLQLLHHRGLARRSGGGWIARRPS